MKPRFFQVSSDITQNTQLPLYGLEFCFYAEVTLFFCVKATDKSGIHKDWVEEHNGNSFRIANGRAEVLFKSLIWTLIKIRA